MKKTFAIGTIVAVMSFLVLLLGAQAVHAAEGTAHANGNASVNESGGIMPDSFLYGLQTAIDRINLALTFDHSAKAEKGLKMAQKRLMEVKAMAARGKSDATAKAEREYERALRTAEKAADSIESDGSSSAARNALEKISALQNRTESHYEKVVEIKEEILERQNNTMSAEQIAHLQDVFDKIEEKAREMETKLDAKKDKVRAKHKALSNLTSEQADDLEEQINEKTGLAQGRHLRAENQIKRAKAAIEHAHEKTAEIKANGVNVDEIEELLDEAERHANNLSSSNHSINKSERDDAEELSDFGNEISALAMSLGNAKKEGNFTAVFEQMKQKIRQRHIEHLQKISAKISEHSEDAEKVTEQAMERSQNRSKDNQENITEEDKSENLYHGEGPEINSE